MRPLIARALFACGCLVLAACGPVSQVPLIDAEQAVQDDRLYGTWVRTDATTGETSFIHIGEYASRQGADAASAPGRMEAWVITVGDRQVAGPDGESKRHFAAGPPLGLSWTSYPLGDDWVASLDTKADVPVSMQKEWEGMQHSGGFWFLKYRVDGRELRVWTVNSDFVAQAIERGELQGTARRVGTSLVKTWEIRITDSQENLRRFFEQYKDRGLFSAQPSLEYLKLGAQ